MLRSELAFQQSSRLWGADVADNNINPNIDRYIHVISGAWRIPA